MGWKWADCLEPFSDPASSKHAAKPKKGHYKLEEKEEPQDQKYYECHDLQYIKFYAFL